MGMIRVWLTLVLVSFSVQLTAAQPWYSLAYRAPETGGSWVPMFDVTDTSGLNRAPAPDRIEGDANRQAQRYCKPSPIWYDSTESTTGLTAGTRGMAGYVVKPLARRHPDAIRVTYFDGRTADFLCSEQ